MRDKKTIVYDPKIVVTEENYEEARKQFIEDAMKNAPKPDEYLEKNVVVKPKLEYVGKTINLSNLLTQYGINKPESNQSNNTNLSNTDKNNFRLDN